MDVDMIYATVVVTSFILGVMSLVILLLLVKLRAEVRTCLDRLLWVQRDISWITSSNTVRRSSNPPSEQHS
jgi:hypothetical protein